MPVHILTNDLEFPPVTDSTPDGLLAIGGDLQPQRLLHAYQQGIFPWYNAEEPILWWSPNPRAVIFPTHFHCSKRLQRTLRQHKFSVTRNACFERVIRSCAQLRQHTGTWIHEEMIEAYLSLHQQGHAHSIEVWYEEVLAGGIYGVQVGPVFSGESMFSQCKDASKIALYFLCKTLEQYPNGLLDCQMHSPHLERLGCTLISREQFICHLESKQGIENL